MRLDRGHDTHCCSPPSAVSHGLSSRRVHGRVSRHAVKWKSIPVVHIERLKDIKYEKGHGEGIAKVCRTFSGRLSCCLLGKLSPVMRHPCFHHIPLKTQ